MESWYAAAGCFAEMERKHWCSWMKKKGNSFSNEKAPGPWVMIIIIIMLQCGRCLGYLHPHNPQGRNVAIPAFVLVFSLVFSPRELYYRGQKNNNNNNNNIQPVTIESHGAFSSCALSFLTSLGEHLTDTSGDLCWTLYLFQRLSVITQQFSSVLLHEIFFSVDEEPDL